MATMWHAGEPDEGVLHVAINQADRPVNAFSTAALVELSQLIARIKGDATLRGVVFRSTKPGNFIAGADVTEFQTIRDAAEAREFSQLGQRVFDELAALSIPTVALIAGACLGGGLEFALACCYRIADDSPKTQIGLPELKLGIIPGWGGTVRLPQVAGYAEGLSLILSGRMMNGRQAARKGIVDDAVPVEAFDYVARELIHRGDTALRPPRKSAFAKLTDKLAPLKKLVLWQAGRQVLDKTHGHYPAALETLEVFRNGVGKSHAEQLELVTDANARLGQNAITRELVRLFFLSEQAKKVPALLNAGHDPPEIEHGAVIGAGAMGAGIALLMAQKGIWTRLKDLNAELLARGVKTARKLIRDDLARRKITPLQATQALDHLSPTDQYAGLKRADLVLEAVVEEIDIKRRVFDDLAAATKPGCVLATNTSSLTVEAIARDVREPERVVGLHFFNPPHQMPLVEVVRGPQTSASAMATAAALAARLGKTLVVVNDCPGFLVNRVLAPYMNEAGYLVTEVEDPLSIDRAAVEFGMPMGPLAIIDLVGVGVSAHVAENMRAAYGERMESAPLWKHLRAEASGDSKPQKVLVKRWGATKLNPAMSKAIRAVAAGPRTTMSHEAIVQRLVYPIINEAARCLEDRVVESADGVDLAMVFGTGFAPFRGGPLRYADSVGIEKIVDVLDRLSAQHPRLAPSDALRRMAAEGRTFHGATERPALVTV